MDNDASAKRSDSRRSGHFTPAMLRLLEFAISTSLEKAEPSQTRQRLFDNAGLVEEGLQDATVAPIHSDAEFEDFFALVDTIKAIVPRRLMGQRSAFGSLFNPPSNAVVMSVSSPSQIRDYFNDLTEATVILSLCLRRDGMVSAFIAQYYPPGELEYTRLPLILGTEGKLFNQLLESYATSLTRSKPDMGILRTLLDVLSRGLTVYFRTHDLPHRLLIIPHRLLHIIPWHMLRLPALNGPTYLPLLVKTIAYASSLKEVRASNVWMPPPTPQINTSMPWVAVIDESAGDLQFIKLESRAFRLYKRLGVNLEIVTTNEGLPLHMDDVSLISWSGHARTNPSQWAGSYLTLENKPITAEEIMCKWTLRASPTVILSNCESSIDMSSLVHSDEYCGLDMAFRIAGARAACGTMWPVSDHTSAVVAVLIVGLLREQGKSAPEALTIVQRGFITGVWRQWRPSHAEIARLAGADSSCAEELEWLQEALYNSDPLAFADPRDWASFRCLGV